MNSKKLLLLFSLILMGGAAMAQDFIHKKNREILKVKVEEVGTSEIKYKEFENPDGPSYYIDKEKISKVELDNGDVLTFNSSKNSMDDPDYYSDDRKNAFKVSFTSLIANHLDFFYERSLSPTSSVEGVIGIIGIGASDPNDNFFDFPRYPSGVMIKGGYKFKRSPDFYLPKMRYGHLLKGGYIKPEIAFSMYGEDYTYYDHPTQQFVTNRESVFAGAFMLNFGKQWVFDNRFALDWFIGVGYGFTNSKNHPDINEQVLEQENPSTSQYGFIVVPGIPIALSAGINLGYVFDWKKDKQKKY